MKIYKDVRELNKEFKKKESYFSKMYLYMTEKLNKTIKIII